jgi:hypothetical protein
MTNRKCITWCGNGAVVATPLLLHTKNEDYRHVRKKNYPNEPPEPSINTNQKRLG